MPERTAGGQRRYSASQLMTQQTTQVQRKYAHGCTVAYSRVSSHDQKKDLEQQQEVLSLYCASKGWQYEIISDLGSRQWYELPQKRLATTAQPDCVRPVGTPDHHPQRPLVTIRRGTGIRLVRSPELRSGYHQPG